MILFCYDLEQLIYKNRNGRLYKLFEFCMFLILDDETGPRNVEFKIFY